MATKVDVVVEAEWEMSKKLKESQYVMKLCQMKSELGEDIKNLDLDCDMEKLMSKVKILKAVLQKFDFVKNWIEKEKIQPEVEPPASGDDKNACVEPRKFHLETPVSHDSNKFCLILGDEKPKEHENAGKRNFVGKYAEESVSYEASMEKILDLRERKLFSYASDMKDVKKLTDRRENLDNFRGKLNLLNPPSEAIYFAPFKKAKKDFVKSDFVVKQKANYAKRERNGVDELLKCSKIIIGNETQRCSNNFFVHCHQFQAAFLHEKLKQLAIYYGRGSTEKLLDLHERNLFYCGTQMCKISVSLQKILEPHDDFYQQADTPCFHKNSKFIKILN